MEWLGARNRHFSDSGIQEGRHLDKESGEQVLWAAEFKKPHRGVIWDKLLLGKSGYKGGIIFTNKGVHTVRYFAYDAYAVQSSRYDDATITAGDKPGQIVINQSIDGENRITQGEFGKESGAVISGFERYRESSAQSA